MQTEQAGGNGAGNGGGDGRGDPDAGVFHDVGHLQHGGAEALAHQTAPAVLPEAHNGEAYHLGAAASHSRTACQTGEAQYGADGGGGDGQGQGYAYQHGHQNTHQEGLKLRGLHNDHTEGAGGGADGRGDNIGRAYADEGGDNGSHQNVDLRLFADGLAALRCDDRHEQHGQGSARAAQQVAGVTHSRQREQHQRGRLQGVADGNGHGGTAHKGGEAAYGVGNLFPDLGGEETDVELRAQRVEDGADQQGAEQALCHSAQGINAIALGGKNDVFALQECVYLFHENTPYRSKIVCQTGVLTPVQHTIHGIGMLVNRKFYPSSRKPACRRASSSRR